MVMPLLKDTYTHEIIMINTVKTDKMKGHGNQPGTEAAIVVRARGRPEEPYIFTCRIMVLCQGGHFNISVAR